MTIDLLPEDKEILLSILANYLPQHTKVWVFGSRSTGKAKKYSDLDLVIDTGSRMTLDLHASLNSDFEESDLPYKVDVVDWNGISESFKEAIEKDRQLLWEQA